MIDNHLDYLVNKIDSKVLQLQEALGDDYAQNFGEYKKMVGEVQGLLTALRYISDLRERLRDSDED